MSRDFPPSVDELVETFEDLEDTQDRVEFIMELGQELPALPEELKTKENLVEGCLSQVWMVVNRTSNGNAHQPRLEILADSDTRIVKGLIVIVLALFWGKSPAEAIREDATQLFAQLGLTQSFLPNRRNGLFAMVQRIRKRAVEIEADRAASAPSAKQAELR